jgi:hypothetical protein
MTGGQLYLVIGVPAAINAVLLGVLMAYISAKFEGVNRRFEGIDKQFENVNKRFDDMRDFWRAELRRVEDVLDARLQHLEESH